MQQMLLDKYKMCEFGHHMGLLVDGRTAAEHAPIALAYERNTRATLEKRLASTTTTGRLDCTCNLVRGPKPALPAHGTAVDRGSGRVSDPRAPLRCKRATRMHAPRLQTCATRRLRLTSPLGTAPLYYRRRVELTSEKGRAPLQAARRRAAQGCMHAPMLHHHPAGCGAARRAGRQHSVMHCVNAQCNNTDGCRARLEARQHAARSQS